MYIINDIVKVFEPIKTVLTQPNLTFSRLSYDTRKMHTGADSLFFALQGQQDGHRFVYEAYQKGVRNFIVSDLALNVENFQDANFIWVKNTLRALQSLVSLHRNSIQIPVIGITGSNGKTIVKEWLSQLLKGLKKVYQSPKSYNSQLGVALSLWDLTNDYDVALIEAGISTVDEMHYLEEMIRPSLGIFTSLGPAHREGFVSKEVKLAEKWNLFIRSKKIFVPSAQVLNEYLSNERIVSWGVSNTDILRVLAIHSYELYTQVHLSYRNYDFELSIPFIDKASIDNALTCVLVLLEIGVSIDIIRDRIALLKPLDMRLQLKMGKNNSSIIDDSYSNDLASLNIALDFLNQQNQYDKKKLILSDFEGEELTAKFLNKLHQVLSTVQLDEIILVGGRFKSMVFDFSRNIHVYESTEDLLSNLSQLNFKDSVVLIKGARKYKLETISRLLTEKSHETILQINLKSLEHNLKQYRSKIDSSVKMMAMVKAFSYGSGSYEVANILQFNNVDYLTVAFVDEGSELRRSGIKLPIMVLSPHESAIDDILEYNLEPEIYSVRILKVFVQYLKNKNINDYPVHIKLDTGMHRLGFMDNEIDELLLILKNQKEVRIKSVFSHLVGAGVESLKDFTAKQFLQFNSNADKINTALGYSFLKHICNTSGIVHHPEGHMDMVRLGIGLYGFDMNPKELTLEQVGVLKTTITQIKHIPKDETIGYDRKGLLTRDSIIATVKIGYADGYSRRFGNGVGEMEINGQLVQTVGNICMDMCMLDITDIEAKEGDEVIVFPDMALAAQNIGTIPYELLTGISSRVKRVYYYE
ncbi:bifunctional UDP-N-acetylmuramoyl-tripeptide:D-alanyl-D-alanine ligase/alanine racemase [Sphingobacterium sp. WQ 366]|uniref:Alanine racemase n=2 Tax=Sphingobacterium bovistauri TaxID=2781959 RepID=A0ABS7Z5T4_9SPHI|nr:bifunctional UDP-N-acetylmuramoyl-tripeptide:D-alanyl-D-alanine ligase/alanine racemase [Sphingobacterium bovistauri]